MSRSLTHLSPALIEPHWPAPARVRAAATTRIGGHSAGAYGTFNLGGRSADDPGAVTANRALLVAALDLPREPCWLDQVHGATVIDATAPTTERLADAAVAARPGVACAVLTADCLPVLLCDADGTRVGAAHVGWRGLAAGVIEATVKRMGTPSARLLAWLGPAIGPRAYEVGSDVRAALEADLGPEAGAAFTRSPAGRWLADLYLLATMRLRLAGVVSIHGGGHCTFTEADRFFSYRRDGETGRMASLIWLD